MRKELKSKIAELVDQQRKLKPQRKTIHFTGDRTMSATDAAYTVQMNKSRLRCLYIVYAELRGKTITDVEPKAKTSPDMTLLEKMRKTYIVELEMV